MVAAIAFGAVFYVACVAVQSLGFGTDAAGVRAFATSPAPLGELATTYVGSGMADALDAAAIISALGAGLGCASVAARMLFALGREGRLPRALAGVSGVGAPSAGLAFVMVLDLAILVVFGAAGTQPMKVFFYFATIGTLSLLVMYLLTNLASMAFLHRRGARAELALPAAGVAVAGYVLYHNVHPAPTRPSRFPVPCRGRVAGHRDRTGLLAPRLIAQRALAGANICRWPTVRPPAPRLLERAAQLEALAERLAAVSAEGRGRLVLVAGEAGIGKTALVRAFCERAAPRCACCAGACDALLHAAAARAVRSTSPTRPAASSRRSCARRRAPGRARRGARARAARPAARRRRARGPALGRRGDARRRAPARAPDRGAAGARARHLPRRRARPRHPLRIVLGELPARRGGADRRCAPLSPAGGGGAGRRGRASTPTSCTAGPRGNPFFVTEVLAGGRRRLPDTVRDAVLARAARLDARRAGAARRRRDRAAARRAVAARGAGRRRRSASSTSASPPACCAPSATRSRFRHEIARVAVEEALPPRPARWRCTGGRSPRSPRVGGARPARLAHHAEAAGDGAAVLRHAPAAGERARRARVPSRGGRAVRPRAALRRGPDAERRAELLERRSYECYLTDAHRRARSRRARRALDEHRARGDRLREGDAHRWLSRLPGSTATTRRPSARRGGRSSCSSRWRPAASWRWPTATWRSCGCWPATAPARASGASGRSSSPSASGRPRSSSTRSTTSARPSSSAGMPRRRGAKLERSLALALEAGLEEHVARAYTNLGAGAVAVARLRARRARPRRGIAYCAEHDLDAWLALHDGLAGARRARPGALGRAAAHAPPRSCGRAGRRDAEPHHAARRSLGRLRARRGDPDPWEPLDEALELARRTGELQRLGAGRGGPRRGALAGRRERGDRRRDRRGAGARARAPRTRWPAGELCVWRRRAG